MLMEIIFPQYDVRFIAVNDGVDSENGIGDFSGIKNYFNDFYARDTSRKIRAVLKAKDAEQRKNHLSRRVCISENRLLLRNS